MNARNIALSHGSTFALGAILMGRHEAINMFMPVFEGKWHENFYFERLDEICRIGDLGAIYQFEASTFSEFSWRKWIWNSNLYAVRRVAMTIDFIAPGFAVHRCS